MIGSKQSQNKLIVFKSDETAKGIIVKGLANQSGFKGKVLTLNDLAKKESISFDDLKEGIGVNSMDLPKGGVGITSGDLIKGGITTEQLLKGYKFPVIKIMTSESKNSSKKPKVRCKKCKTQLSLVGKGINCPKCGEPTA